MNTSRVQACRWAGAMLAMLAGLGRLGAADAEPTFAGAAFGTTYRVMLAAALPDRPIGELHREVERVLRRIDRSASTWRDDSDAARFNRAAAGEWVAVGEDLVAILQLAGRVHEDSGGAFDPTVAPLLGLWSQDREQEPSAQAIARARGLIGLGHVECRVPQAVGGDPAGGAVRKLRDGVTIDLGGIGPGYAVDRIGECLAVLGSRGHLVVLGGEARAWGRRSDGSVWQVSLGRGHVVTLEGGEAIATSTPRPGRSPVDPRTGRPVETTGSRSVRAASCAEADAWAVAAVVLGLEPSPDGLVDRRGPEPREGW